MVRMCDVHFEKIETQGIRRSKNFNNSLDCAGWSYVHSICGLLNAGASSSTTSLHSPLKGSLNVPCSNRGDPESRTLWPVGFAGRHQRGCQRTSSHLYVYVNVSEQDGSHFVCVWIAKTCPILEQTQDVLPDHVSFDPFLPLQTITDFGHRSIGMTQASLSQSLCIQ